MIRPILLVGLLSMAAVSVRAAECPKNTQGELQVTGEGRASKTASSDGASRLGAERAAYLDALGKLKACLGDDAARLSGWSLAETRYYDADPVVEVDLVARLGEGEKTVTASGSALPNLKSAQAAGGNVQVARLTATRAAVVAAERNALEALELMLPAASAAGDLRQQFAGVLGACTTSEITYWDDRAVSVRVTCGKAAGEAEKPEPKPQPAVRKRGPSAH